MYMTPKNSTTCLRNERMAHHHLLGSLAYRSWAQAHDRQQPNEACRYYCCATHPQRSHRRARTVCRGLVRACNVGRSCGEFHHGFGWASASSTANRVAPAFTGLCAGRQPLRHRNPPPRILLCLLQSGFDGGFGVGAHLVGGVAGPCCFDLWNERATCRH